ncbi:kinase-like protein [Penicillium angulare]|uniref:Kinase-like protein n=1 Tax=Penicillium angulare TaxID=116970 RepID=A0A9W9FVL8_9EURO|nr:kinase-like protein [Penicillium angulare]
MALPETIQRASVIAACVDPSPNNVVSQYGKRVIKIPDNKVVKYGISVTKEEAENQRIAYELVDSRIVRIPRVFDFFSDGELGYIVMGFIEGKVIDPLEDTASIKKIANILDHFATLRYITPGSLYGGPCHGLLFGDPEELVFDSTDAMEKWFNSRLYPHNTKLNFQGFDLVLFHLDVAPRNNLWQKDGSVCLLDWASAGFYPKLFEFCMQWIFEGKEGRFTSVLLESMNSLPEQELAQKDSMMWAWRNIQRYAFPKDDFELPNTRPRDSTKWLLFPPPPMPAYPDEWLEEARRAGIVLQTESNSTDPEPSDRRAEK